MTEPLSRDEADLNATENSVASPSRQRLRRSFTPASTKVMAWLALSIVSVVFNGLLHPRPGAAVELSGPEYVRGMQFITRRYRARGKILLYKKPLGARVKCFVSDAATAVECGGYLDKKQENYGSDPCRVLSQKPSSTCSRGRLEESL